MYMYVLVETSFVRLSPHQAHQRQQLIQYPSFVGRYFIMLYVVVLLATFGIFSVTSFGLRHPSQKLHRHCVHNQRLFGANNVEIIGITPPLGSVALVGAGPGDPDLLTVQAVRLLSQAGLVISDRLVAKEILDTITCELRIAKKRPGCAEEAQEEIYQWTKDAVLAGKHVVRLKIGDPFLFGRGGEEVLEFRKLGVEPLLVPGVSSSYAAPLSAKIPLTHRGVSNSVLISTGYGRNEAIIEIPEYSADRTVVLLMAVGRIEEIAANMTMMGYPKETPVAIIEKATTPLQRTLSGTLETIGFVAKRDGATAPGEDCIAAPYVTYLRSKLMLSGQQLTNLALSRHQQPS
jgi:uroporphyrin-III C-methyltransferase